MHQAQARKHRDIRALNDQFNNPRPERAEKRRRDFGIIGRALQDSAADFVSRLPLESGERLLDVSCGTGIASIPAARAGADVTGVDHREPFLSRGRAWAKNEHLLIRFKRAEPERLPFSDGNFHAAFNFMGLPFARNPSTAAGEMQRVCRPGSVMAVTAWDPAGLIGSMLHVAYQYSCDDGLRRALELCDLDAIQELFGDACDRADAGPRNAGLQFPLSPADTVACYLDFHAPLQEAADALEPEARDALRNELTALWEEHGDAVGDSTRADVRYRELILTRR